MISKIDWFPTNFLIKWINPREEKEKISRQKHFSLLPRFRIFFKRNKAPLPIYEKGSGPMDSTDGCINHRSKLLNGTSSWIVARNSGRRGAIRRGRGEGRKRSTRNLQALVPTRNVSLRRYNEAPRRPRRRMFRPSQLLVISVSGRMVAPRFGDDRRKKDRDREERRFQDRGGEKSVQRGNSTEKKARWFLDKPLYRGGQRTR